MLAHRSLFSRVIYLQEPHEEKKIESNRKPIVVQGLLRMNMRGFGFVTEIENYPDVFIPKGGLDSAVDGDRVEVRITAENFEGKGPEGKISQVLDRARKHLALILTKTGDKSKSLGYSHVLGPHRSIEIYHKKAKDLKAGDRIIAEVKDWGSKYKPLKANFVSKIGHIDEAKFDIKAACEEFLIRDNFPQEALDEAALFGKSVKKINLLAELICRINPALQLTLKQRVILMMLFM